MGEKDEIRNETKNSICNNGCRNIGMWIYDCDINI